MSGGLSPSGSERYITPDQLVPDLVEPPRLAKRDFGITVACSGCYCHHRCGPCGRSYLCHAHTSPKPWSNYIEKADMLRTADHQTLNFL